MAMSRTFRPNIPGDYPTCQHLDDLLTRHPEIHEIWIPAKPYPGLIIPPAVAHWPGNGYDLALLEFKPGPDLVDSIAEAGWALTAWSPFRWYERDPGDLGQLVRLIADRYPEAESRAARAADIVRRQDVHQTLGKHCYSVRSYPERRRVYQVQIPPDNRKNWTCIIVQDIHPGTTTHIKCPDIANGAPYLKNGRRCKHMLAAWMHSRLHPPTNGPGHQMKEAPTAQVEASEELSPPITRDDDSTDCSTCQLKAVACQTCPLSSDLYTQFDLSQPDPELFRRIR